MKTRNIYLFILVCLFTLIGCSQVKKSKNNHASDTTNNLIEFEDIYSSQQQSGDELGPWWIFYKVKIDNSTDSTISLYPKKELVSVKDVESIRNRKEALKSDELLKQLISTSDSGVGDAFLLFKNDTIPLYCTYSPITLSRDSCHHYLFYTNPVEIKRLYDSYVQEYEEFQSFLSDIVKNSAFVVIFNKKETCYYSPDIELHFYGDPTEQSEWDFLPNNCC